MSNICFSAISEAFYNTIPRPTPAAKMPPEWLKKMSSKIDHPRVIKHLDVFDNGGSIGQALTLKRCPPVNDMIGAGYIISTHCDILVHSDLENNFLDMMWKSSLNAIETHTSEQVVGSPVEKFMQNDAIFKYINPWRIKTQRGYSCMFMAPQYRDLPFIALSGIVQTDKFHEVNFPFIYNGLDGQHVIPAGTPVCQIIPFKRETFKSSISFETPLQTETYLSMMTNKFNRVYADLRDKVMKFK